MIGRLASFRKDSRMTEANLRTKLEGLKRLSMSVQEKQNKWNLEFINSIKDFKNWPMLKGRIKIMRTKL